MLSCEICREVSLKSCEVLFHYDWSPFVWAHNPQGFSIVNVMPCIRYNLILRSIWSGDTICSALGNVKEGTTIERFFEFMNLSEHVKFRRLLRTYYEH